MFRLSCGVLHCCFAVAAGWGWATGNGKGARGTSTSGPWQCPTRTYAFQGPRLAFFGCPCRSDDRTAAGVWRRHRQKLRRGGCVSNCCCRWLPRYGVHARLAPWILADIPSICTRLLWARVEGLHAERCMDFYPQMELPNEETSRLEMNVSSSRQIRCRLIPLQLLLLGSQGHRRAIPMPALRRAWPPIAVVACCLWPAALVWMPISASRGQPSNSLDHCPPISPSSTP